MSYDNLSSVSQNVLKFYQQLTGEERRIPFIFDDFYFCYFRPLRSFDFQDFYQSTKTGIFFSNKYISGTKSKIKIKNRIN
jgi:hypothetical protein